MYDEVLETLSAKALAFNVISAFIEETYGDMSVSNVTPEEAFLIGVIRMTDAVISNLSPSEKEED